MPRHVRQLSRRQLIELGTPADGIPLLFGTENFLAWDSALKTKLKVLSMDHVLAPNAPAPAKPSPDDYNFSSRHDQGAYATACRVYYRSRYEHGHAFAMIKLSVRKDVFGAIQAAVPGNDKHENNSSSSSKHNAVAATAPHKLYRRIADCFAPTGLRAFRLWTDLRFRRGLETKADFARRWRDARRWAVARSGTPVSAQCAVTTFLVAVSAFVEAWDFAQAVLGREVAADVDEVIEEWLGLDDGGGDDVESGRQRG